MNQLDNIQDRQCQTTAATQRIAILLRNSASGVPGQSEIQAPESFEEALIAEAMAGDALGCGFSCPSGSA